MAKRITTGQPFPKVKKHRRKGADDAALDKAESKLVRERSGGRCEVWEFTCRMLLQCRRRAVHVHHMIGGRGKRGIGLSALKEHKQDVCEQCHLDITGDVGGKRLKRVGDVLPRWTDYYERVRAHAA